jgi:hypothetical protein
MANKFKENVKKKKELDLKKAEYDWVDERGKGWRLKEGEDLAKLKERAKDAK